VFSVTIILFNVLECCYLDRLVIKTKYSLCQSPIVGLLAEDYNHCKRIRGNLA